MIRLIARILTRLRSSSALPGPERCDSRADLAAIQRQARALRLAIRPALIDETAGAYRGARPGQGLTFAELRAYEPGDDVRRMDWNASARLGRPYVRRFIEERGLTLRLLVDLSPSMGFGREIQGRTKRDQAIRAAMLLGASAIAAGDRAGLKLIGSNTQAELKPAAGAKQSRRIAKFLTQAQGWSTNPRKAADWTSALASLHRERRRGMAIVISDFLDPISPTAHADWRAAARRHDLIAVRIADPLEERLPNAGLLQLQDAETSASDWRDSSSARLRESYEQAAIERRAAFRRFVAEAGIESVDLSTTDQPFRVFKRFFARRARKIRR